VDEGGLQYKDLRNIFFLLLKENIFNLIKKILWYRKKIEIVAYRKAFLKLDFLPKPLPFSNYRKDLINL